MNKPNLFHKGDTILSSGRKTSFKIECDSLEDCDWGTLAYIIACKYRFKKVYGVPTGGNKLAARLREYEMQGEDMPILIVDDVFTTGMSINNFAVDLVGSGVITRQEYEQRIGVVAFSRGVCPAWIHPIFQMW